jgi:hypothetical protein
LINKSIVQTNEYIKWQDNKFSIVMDIELLRQQNKNYITDYSLSNKDYIPYQEVSEHYKKSISDEIIYIIMDAYSPYKIYNRLWTVCKIRSLKIMAIIFNQKTGKYIFGWNGKENKLLDKAGYLTNKLYESQYKTPLTETIVYTFLRRRLHYAFITIIATIIQCILTIYNQIVICIIISIILSPITLLDRQWATSVTKNSPRYLREFVFNHLQEQLSTILLLYKQYYENYIEHATLHNDNTKMIMSTGMGIDTIKNFNVVQHIKVPLSITLLSIISSFTGFVQFVTGFVLFVLPFLCIMYNDVRDYNFNNTISMLWFLNIIRATKEIANLIAPICEFYVIPARYIQAKQTLSLFIDSLENVSLTFLFNAVRLTTPILDAHVYQCLNLYEKNKLLQAKRSLNANIKVFTPFDNKNTIKSNFNYTMLPHFLQISITGKEIDILCCIFEGIIHEDA